MSLTPEGEAAFAADLTDGELGALVLAIADACSPLAVPYLVEAAHRLERRWIDEAMLLKPGVAVDADARLRAALRGLRRLRGVADD